MQTFMPYPDFEASAKALDRARLGKQRVEVLQILNTLLRNSIGWSNHPAVRMWRGHEGSLIVYGQCVCREWILRGYKDTCLEKIGCYSGPTKLPAWVGDEEFHSSHRAALLHKNYEWYSSFGWREVPKLEYKWPQ